MVFRILILSTVPFKNYLWEGRNFKESVYNNDIKSARKRKGLSADGRKNRNRMKISVQWERTCRAEHR